MGLGLVTNGRMLAYRDLVERLLEHRLEYVYLSMHGGTPRINDLMVRADGAFEQTYAALGNLSGRGIDLTVNCVITRHNVDHLVSLIDACLPFEDAKVKLSMVEPKGGGDRLFEHLMPKISYVAEKVLDALEHGRRSIEVRGAKGPTLLHGGVPLCLVPGWEHAYDDLRTHRFATMVEIGEPDLFPVDDANKIQPESVCGGCTLRGPCPGLYKGYESAFGSGELRPRRDGARSNSFDWTLEAVVASELRPDSACPIREDGVTPWEPGRHLFVRHGGRLARYRADGRDFADVEIARIKHELGQIYLDASRGKDAPDDFARELVKLERSGQCAPCPERERCTGIFEPRFDDIFGGDDAQLRAIVAGLEGDVLDVGCGEGPYEEVLAPRARSGAIRYVGIDPDAARIASLRARRPWAELEVRGAESIEEESAYDAILVVRSWNHIADPADAARRIVRALRPGGRLIVADDVAFGLARTKAQTERAQRGAAKLEHRRVDGASEAWRALEGLGLRARARREAGPATSTMWWLDTERV
jgi:SAM-dependent methyltransferase